MHGYLDNLIRRTPPFNEADIKLLYDSVMSLPKEDEFIRFDLIPWNYEIYKEKDPIRFEIYAYLESLFINTIYLNSMKQHELKIPDFPPIPAKLLGVYEDSQLIKSSYSSGLDNNSTSSSSENDCSNIFYPIYDIYWIDPFGNPHRRGYDCDWDNPIYVESREQFEYLLANFLATCPVQLYPKPSQSE